MPFPGAQASRELRAGVFTRTRNLTHRANTLRRAIAYFVISPFSMANAVSDEAL